MIKITLLSLFLFSPLFINAEEDSHKEECLEKVAAAKQKCEGETDPKRKVKCEQFQFQTLPTKCSDYTEGADNAKDQKTLRKFLNSVQIKD